MKTKDIILFKKLKRFYKEVARLTVCHEVIRDYAHVSPANLDKALIKIDKNWCKNSGII